MKKLLLSAFGLSLGMTAFAQLPVNQSTENRHAILEEFTGIYCGYCPDGHAIGNTLTTNNPGTFHKIHIHAGGYANPSGNDPDFRTTEGTAIDNAGAPSGYPNGGINRGNGTGWSMGRGSWTSSSNTVMGQSSYVNVAVEGTVNSSTRQLVVDAEVYYTGSAPSGTQYLTVALLQNGMGGTQTDYGNYNPSGWKCPGTVYNHGHVLRMLVNTGSTNGDAVNTGTAGVVSKQYTVTLPATIGGEDLELGSLELVAFITEGSNLTTPIVSGNEGPVVVTGTSAADMSASDNHTAPAGLCDNQFTPMVTVTNNSSSSITGVDVTYYLNGTPTTVNLPSQTIAAGGTYNHSFTQTTLNSGSNEIYYEVTLTDAGFDDMSALNNTSCPDFINVMPTGTFGTQHSEGYESMSLGDDTPANAILIEPNDIRAYVVNQGVSGTVTWPIGGYGNSANSYRYDFWAINSGEYSEIVWEKLDFSGSGSYSMSFDVSYKQYNGSNDRIEVYASTDCGQNWAQVFFEQGSTLASGNAPNNSARHYPANGGGDWHTKTINLSTYNGQPEVMIRIKGTSAGGNSAYVDNINISTSVGIDEVVTENSVDIYPNPTNDVSTISFTLNETALVSLDVYNAMGSLVFKKGTESMNSGIQKIAFDGTELPSGMYFVNLTVGNKVITKKVSILK